MIRALPILVLLASSVSTARACDPPPSSVRVTVVVVLATTENNVVDPKLTALAQGGPEAGRDTRRVQAGGDSVEVDSGRGLARIRPGGKAETGGEDR